MTHRLARANVENNPDILDEVSSLMNSIKNAWEQVPNELGEQGMKEYAENIINHSQQKNL